MHNADTQCTAGGERRPKGREEFLHLNFSCLPINMNFISHKKEVTGHGREMGWGEFWGIRGRDTVELRTE